MIINEPHQKLVDGISALVLRKLMTQDEARKVISFYKDLPTSVDEAALHSIYKDYGLNEEGLDDTH
jgi:hypothetical protein